MANLNIHPAPGLGDLMAGYFVVPQNPIEMAQQGISVMPGLGDFMSASFVVPQNPLLSQITGTVQPIGQGAAGTPMVKKSKGMGGCGCGCGGGCGGGMGTLSTDFTQFTTDLTAGNYTTAFTTDTIMGLPVWAIAALGVGIAYIMGAGGGKRGR